jgi:endonuclease/exonuclease/phosphatase family metal-dependent hydrolase
VDGLRWLGAELGYHTAFGAGTRHRSYGVGLLSRWPIENVEVVELPVERSLTRLALVATVRAPGGPVPVVSTHLSIGAEDGTGDAKPAQIQRILDRAGEFDRAVVAGDFNLRPDQPEYDRLTAKFTDAWRAATERTGTPETYTPQRPRKRIDYVFLQGEWTVHEAATVGSEHVSDHKGVLAEIERATE